MIWIFSNWKNNFELLSANAKQTYFLSTVLFLYSQENVFLFLFRQVKYFFPRLKSHRLIIIIIFLFFTNFHQHISTDNKWCALCALTKVTCFYVLAILF